MIGLGTPIAGVNKTIKCRIYANIALQTSRNFNNHDIQKTWSHEIGHSLGLNETNTNPPYVPIKSVMRQGRGQDFGWDNYWKPQDHDRSDLNRFNYKSWSII